MAVEQFTRCPGCKTVFRVTDAQLALREGQVRCGHCRTVFNGREELISLAPPEGGANEPELDELAAGPPTVTLRSARALDPPPPDEPRADPVVDYENRFSWRKKREPSRLWSVLGMIAIPALVVAFVLQAMFHFRDSIAAYVPTTKPMLTRVCALVGCAIRPLRDVAPLSIDASDLQADPAHRGLLDPDRHHPQSRAIRNRLSASELTLTDAQDQVVVRRALAPADYVSGTAQHRRGHRRNGEVPSSCSSMPARRRSGYRSTFFPLTRHAEENRVAHRGAAACARVRRVMPARGN
jgi:predicted Zn finger-like uncharacterized protein